MEAYVNYNRERVDNVHPTSSTDNTFESVVSIEFSEGSFKCYK